MLDEAYQFFNIATVYNLLAFNFLRLIYNLGRDVKDLSDKLEEERLSRAMNEEAKQVSVHSLSNDVPTVDGNDQMELKTMVDAIATASQREAEAHQTAIILSQENEGLQSKLKVLSEEKIELTRSNDELRLKQKVLIEEKSRLIELYERAVEECNYQKLNKTELAEDKGNGGSLDTLVEEIEAEKKKVENLEHQLMEMNEENEKLMGLYEKAMQERDEFKRMVSAIQSRGETDCAEKLVEVDAGPDLPGSSGQHGGEKSNDLNLVRGKLSDSAKTVALFDTVREAFADIKKLSSEMKATEDNIQVKQQQLGMQKLLISEKEERKALSENKLSALKYSLPSFSSTLAYFEQREDRARARVTSALSELHQKKQEAAQLQASKREIDSALRKIQQSEAEIRNNLAFLKSKMEEENKRQESEKVLFAIDSNIEKSNLNFGGKATDLLKSEEAKTKLQNDMKSCREKLGSLKREFEDWTKKSWKIESDIQPIQMEIQGSRRKVEQLERALEDVIKEKETLLDVEEKGKKDTEVMILEYYQNVMEIELKKAEFEVLEEEMQELLNREQVQKLNKAKLMELELENIMETIK